MEKILNSTVFNYFIRWIHNSYICDGTSLPSPNESNPINYNNENVRSHLLCQHKHFSRWRIAHFVLIINRTSLTWSVRFHFVHFLICLDILGTIHLSNILTQRIVFTLTIELIYRIELTASDSSQASSTSYFSMELKYLKKTKTAFLQIAITLWYILTWRLFWEICLRRRHKFNFIRASTFDSVFFFLQQRKHFINAQIFKI